MANYRVRASGSIEAIIRSKSLPRQVSLTFDSIESAKAYCEPVDAQLRAGIVPQGLLERATRSSRHRPAMDNTLRTLVESYRLEYDVKADDLSWLRLIANEVGDTRIEAVSVQWAADLIKGYKIARHLKPSTIRHRIGALRRCLDWAVVMKKSMPVNPLRLLPDRYAVYAPSEVKVLAEAGIEAPDSNNERDRRLLPGEEERIRKVLSGDRTYLKSIKAQRMLDPENSVPFSLLFELALETAMRLSEIFTLRIDQIDLKNKTIFLDKTKNGTKRQVPLSSVAVSALTEYLRDKGDSGLLFPEFWNGDTSKRAKDQARSRLSGRWATIARLAKCKDLHFHDLRHEATSRFFERTKMSEFKIAKITGHKDMKSLARYANLRASNLAEEMW